MEPRMQELLISSSGHILDSLDNNLVGMWDKNFVLKRYYKGLFSDFPVGYHVVPLPENKLLLSSETKLFMINLEDGSRRCIWDCNHKIQLFDVTGHLEPRYFYLNYRIRLYLTCSD